MIRLIWTLGDTVAFTVQSQRTNETLKKQQLSGHKKAFY